MFQLQLKPSQPSFFARSGLYSYIHLQQRTRIQDLQQRKMPATMPFSAILHLNLICALAAAASAMASDPSLPWEMDSFDQDVFIRTSVPKQTRSGEQAERIVFRFLTSLLWSLSKHVFWALLGYVAIRVVPRIRLGEWARETIRQIAPQLRTDLRRLLHSFALLVVATNRAITQNHYVLDARQAIRYRYDSTQQRVDRSYDSFTNASIFATTYVLYQRLINWTGRRKYHLIVGIVAIHLLSTMVCSQNAEADEVFVTWNELQQYIDQPIPWHMFRQRSEDGSNSHYWPSQLIDNASLESAGPISTMLPAPATVMAFCHHCRQKHCCEVYL